MYEEWLAAGGPVLWIILFCGAVGLFVFIERALHLHRARIQHRDFLMGIKNLLGRGSSQEALAICEDTPGPVARLVYVAISHRNEKREILREELDSFGISEISRMERRISVLSVITQVAPLLGLLGTVFGILETLLEMRDKAPLVEISSVTGGLFQALITTAAGLLVAIPCYCMFNLLVIKIDRIVVDMEQSVTDVLRFLSLNPSTEEVTTVTETKQ